VTTTDFLVLCLPLAWWMGARWGYGVGRAEGELETGRAIRRWILNHPVTIRDSPGELMEYIETEFVGERWKE
jgi:hypothetical protein